MSRRLSPLFLAVGIVAALLVAAPAVVDAHPVAGHLAAAVTGSVRTVTVPGVAVRTDRTGASAARLGFAVAARLAAVLGLALLGLTVADRHRPAHHVSSAGPFGRAPPSA